MLYPAGASQKDLVKLSLVIHLTSKEGKGHEKRQDIKGRE